MKICHLWKRSGILLALVLAGASQAQEFSREHEPAPESVEDMENPLQRAFQMRREAKSLFPRLRNQLNEMSPFFSDTKVSLQPRLYYFDRHNLDGSYTQAMAAGGSLDYQSGWFQDWLSIGSVLYTSQNLIGEKDRDGSGLLKPDQHGYTVLGQLYAQARYQQHHLRVYKIELNLPYVNQQDSRMTPTTFEAYTLSARSNSIPVLGRIDYITGYVREMKKRNADQFISMSDAAGVSSKDRGMALGGFLLHPLDDFKIGLVDYYVDDVINIAYAEADYSMKLTEDFGIRFDVQFTDQRSVGDDLLTGSGFDTQVAGGRLSASYRNVVLSLAGSTTSNEERIRSPFGTYPGYLSLMRSDFNRAGEDAWLAGISYNFRALGLEELSMFSNYARGRGARDAATGQSLGDQWEVDVTLDYRLTDGPLSGLWFRLRHAWHDVDGAEQTSRELRAIVYYSARIL